MLKDAEIAKQFAVQGATPIGGTPADFGAHMKADTGTWAKVIKEAGIKPER